MRKHNSQSTVRNMQSTVKGTLAMLLVMLSFGAYSQVDLTLYNMKSIPQSVYNNPAAVPNSKLNIGLPVISSMYFYVSNSGFAYSDLIKRRADDSLNVDINNAISEMGDKNFLGFATAIDLFSFGIKVKRNYFCLNITEKASFNFTYTKDFFDLFENGNTKFQGKSANLSDLGFDATHYREYGLSMAHELNDKWTIGGRIKYLYGMENISTDQSDLTLYTDARTYDLALTSGVNVNTSALTNNGSKAYDDLDAGDYFFGQHNHGWGLDLGGHYKMNEKWNFSASMVDLGYIHWESNVKNYRANTTTYNFEGIDLINFVHDTADKGQNILDSLNDAFKPAETKEAYNTSLSTHFYLGGNYVMNEKRFAGLLLRGQIFKGIFIPSATLSINQEVGRHLAVSLSYSALNRSYNNIGLGLAANAGPVQLYVVSDNVLGALQPLDAHTFNVHFGINLIMGRPKKDRDKDGVADKSDLCPDIPGLASLHGCPDRDEDGIADNDDQCPDVKGLAQFQGCPDTDGDGIADKDDACPSEKGLAEFKGCPDTDGDGVMDKEDSCVTVKGLAQFHGCPDTDGDGIADPQDSCPNAKGLAEFHGCPDTDADGIADPLDSCPNVKGPASNHGCPVVEKIEVKKEEPVKATLTKQEEEVLNKVFKNLEFETGKSVIRQTSYSSLNELAELMKKKPSFKLLIEGHTDNVGSAASNMKLSENRANAVKLYLTEKGVDAARITSKGYGLTKPIASNKTAEGRQKNRRVEFTVLE